LAGKLNLYNKKLWDSYQHISCELGAPLVVRKPGSYSYQRICLTKAQICGKKFLSWWKTFPLYVGSTHSYQIEFWDLGTSYLWSDIIVATKIYWRTYNSRITPSTIENISCYYISTNMWVVTLQIFSKLVVNNISSLCFSFLLTSTYDIGHLSFLIVMNLCSKINKSIYI